MNMILKQMSVLYEQELYTDIVRLGELTLSFCESKQDVMIHFVKFELYVYYGEALYNTQQYIAAENAYSTALQIRKHLIKSKSAAKLSDGEKGLISDIDIKYKLHMCCVKMKHYQKAIEVLNSIPARSRTPKINMALANLYRDSGNERSAVSCYKEVLRECPLALDAAENLLKLGLQGIEVNSLMLVPTAEVGWISLWLRGLAEMHSREHKSAIATFKSLDISGLLKDNIQVLVNMAHCYNYLCDDKKAMAILQRVTRIDPNFVNGRDFLATLLGNSPEKEHHLELERLIPDFDMALWLSEHWVVMGYHMFVNDKYERAAYFGQQACYLNRRNVEGLLLKAATLMQINKYQEAACHYREALQCCPYRFESNHGLVQSYVAMSRLREATTVANNACKQMNHAAAALTLFASVLLKDPMSSARARNVLERAIESEPSYIPPVCLLAEHLQHEQSYDKAISLLRRHIDINPCPRLHQMLGDCYVYVQKDDEASTHYSIALRMDPQNQRASEGMNNIGRSPSSNNLDSSYYMSVGETSTYASQPPTGSDHEADPDSDTEQWPTNARELLQFD